MGAQAGDLAGFCSCVASEGAARGMNGRFGSYKNDDGELEEVLALCYQVHVVQ